MRTQLICLSLFFFVGNVAYTTPLQLGLGVQPFTPKGVSHGRDWRDTDLTETGTLPMVSGEVSWGGYPTQFFNNRPATIGLFAQLNFTEKTIPLTEIDQTNPSDEASLQAFVSVLGSQIEMQPLPRHSFFLGFKPGLGTVTYLRKSRQTDGNDTLDALIYTAGIYASYEVFRSGFMYLEYDYRNLVNTNQLKRMDVQHHNATVGLRMAVF